MHSVKISRCSLYGISVLTLLVPNMLFLMTWVRIEIMVPCCILLICAYGTFLKTLKASAFQSAFEEQKRVWEVSYLTVIACIACASLWAFLSGIGGYFYQNDDFYGRNAIFHDLLENSWPVMYDGTSYALTYYIAYWIFPAMIGKLCALLFGTQTLWLSANFVLYLETVWFLFLILMVFLSLVNIHSLFPACGFMLLFVLFSGMDGLACFFLRDWTDQIEWWAQTWQYSSHTTCLFWVFNQALPAWLATLLFMCLPTRTDLYAFIGLCILPFSPLPLVGFVFFSAGLFIFSLRLEKSVSEMVKKVRQVFSPCNLLMIVGSIPCLLYLSSNAATRNAPFRIDLFLNAYSLGISLLRLLVFHLIEWAVYACIMMRAWRNNDLFIVCVISLSIIPVFRVGYNMDFSMRASIPGLLVLSVYCARFLRDNIMKRRWLASTLLVMALLIGSITPMLEFQRGAYKVMKAGTNRIFSDPYKTVLHPYADTENFICTDVAESVFYRFIARKP